MKEDCSLFFSYILQEFSLYIFKQKAAMLRFYILLTFAGEYILTVLASAGGWGHASINASCNDSYLPFPLFFNVFLLFVSLSVNIQANSQLLPGSCNFESNTCGYTSDADFMSWTLQKDGT